MGRAIPAELKLDLANVLLRFAAVGPYNLRLASPTSVAGSTMSPAERTYAFGPFVADTSRRILLRNGEVVPVTAKVLDLLLLLLQNRDRLVGKDEISRHLWPDTHVSETNLAVNVSALRKALGDSRDAGAFIVTVTGRGYRFAAPVAIGEDAGDATVAAPTEAGPRTLAVLPFRPLGAGRHDEALELGLTDALITRLSRLSSLVVRPTTSVVRFAGREISVNEAGAALKVQAVLTGGLQRMKGQVRVTTQLVRVSDGATIWGQTFDEKAGHIFRIEDSVSRRVVTALRLQLSRAERSALTVQHTDNSKAYELYLRSRYFCNKRTDLALLKGIECAEAAIAEDPNFALAHAAVADGYAALAFFGGVHPRTAQSRALVAAGKALALDGSLAEAHTALACASLGNWDWKTAGSCFDRALELNPRHANAHYWRSSYLLSVGKDREAVAEAELARDLEPLSLVFAAHLAWVLLLVGRYEAGLRQAERVAEMDRHHVFAQWVTSLALLQLGRLPEAAHELEEAQAQSGASPYLLCAQAHLQALSGHKRRTLEILRQLESLSSERYVSPLGVAAVHVVLGDYAAAFKSLERAFEDRYGNLVYLAVNPQLSPLRGDPRFHDLARRIGIPQA
jgi:DNA-binding winged helix-turn-helix (wHTH) protein/tetratricopeptide (TPR) repeat protein